MAVGLAALSMILKLILHKQETQGTRFRRESLEALSDRRYGWKVSKFLPNSVNSIGTDGEIRIRDEGPARITLLREFAKVDSFEREREKEGKTNLFSSVGYVSLLTSIFMV